MGLELLDICLSCKVSKVLANPIPQGTFNVFHSHNRQQESEWISEKRSLIDNHYSLVSIYIKTIYSPTTLPIIERDQIQSVLFNRNFSPILLFYTK